MEDRKINVYSPEYMFGQVATQLTVIEKKVDAHNGKIDKLTEVVAEQTKEIAALPCGVHGERLERFATWQEDVCEDKTYMARSGIVFRQKILIAVISGAVGAAIACLVSALAGVPAVP